MSTKGRKTAFSKPSKGTVKGTVSNKHKRNTAGLRPPWRPGQSGNPNGMKRGAKNAQNELHRCFNDLLAEEDPKTKQTNIERVFRKLLKYLDSPKTGVVAARALMAWGVGNPNQQIKVMQDVDLNIRFADSVQEVPISGRENVEIHHE